MKKIFGFKSNFFNTSLTGNGSIVSRNLVVHLDASDPNSNTGSGNVWYDISGNGHNLYMNNPNRESEFGGAIRISTNTGQLDHYGSSGYSSFGVIPRIQTANEITLCAWCKNTGFSSYVNGTDAFSPIFSIDQYNRGSQYVKFNIYTYWNRGEISLNGVAPYQANARVLATNADAGSPFNRAAYIVWSRSSTSSKLYVDGQLVASNAGGPMNTNAIGDFQLGGRVSPVNGNFYPGQFVGLFYQAQVYDVQLTDAEVLENFNVDKIKFGL